MQAKGFFQAISSRAIAGFRYFIASGLLFMANPSIADVLSDLSNADQAAIGRLCLPVQYQSGAEAYRECVLTEASIRGDQETTAIAALSFDEQYAVQQVCQPSTVATDSAYQQCVNRQLDGLGQIRTTQLDSFDNDEIYAIQQSCFETQTGGGVKAYRQCINAASTELQSLPKPDLSALTLLERNVVQRDCSKRNASTSDYRQCLLEAVGGTVPAPTESLSDVAVDTSATENVAESAAVGNAVVVAQSDLPTPVVESASEPSSDPLPSDSTRGTTQLADTSVTTPVVEATVPLNLTEASQSLDITDSKDASDSSSTTDVLETSDSSNRTASMEADVLTENVISQPGANNTADSSEVSIANTDADRSTTTSQTDTTSSSTLETTELAPPESGLEQATSVANLIWAKVQTAVSGMNNMSRMIVTAAMALPILLIGFWFLMRGKKQEPQHEYYAPGERNPLIDRVGPSQQRRDQPVRDFDVPVAQADHLNLSRQADDMFGEMPEASPGETESATAFVNTDSLRADSAPAPSLTPSTKYNIQADDSSGSNTPGQLGSTERAGLLAWLNHQPTEIRQSLAIEFLIYWLAYGDDRYEPALKEAIFQIKEPDEHEQIKRWVLMQDIYAFSDVVYWLQHNASITQKQQILDLLMALLINENALTPVQNTIVRFLGDAFGLDHDQLDAQFRHAFGHPMPPLPRVDKPRWWDGQAEEQRARWDARTVSMQSRDIQYRVKLGLPLSGEIREKDVVASFRRAAVRCNAQRFSELGARERSLAEGQFEKFEFAKNSLLEVSV